VSHSDQQLPTAIMSFTGQEHLQGLSAQVLNNVSIDEGVLGYDWLSEGCCPSIMRVLEWLDSNDFYY